MVTTRHSLIPTYRAMTVVGSVITINSEGEVRVALCTDTTAPMPLAVHYTMLPKAPGSGR